MNDPIKPPSKDLQNLELDAFEQQLRSLTPRAANFQLTEQPLVQIANAIPERATAGYRARRTTWAVTLLITWSLGAAVGILFTLAFLQPRTIDGTTQSTTAQSTSRQDNANIEVDAMPRDAEFEEPPKPTLANSIASAEDSQMTRPAAVPVDKGPIHQSNPFAVAIFPWQLSVAQSGDAEALTPLSRSTRNIDFGYSESWTANSTLRESPSAGQQINRGMEPISPIVPVKLEVPPPTNQRDMLRNLLDSYGQVY